MLKMIEITVVAVEINAWKVKSALTVSANVQQEKICAMTNVSILDSMGFIVANAVKDAKQVNNALTEPALIDALQVQPNASVLVLTSKAATKIVENAECVVLAVNSVQVALVNAHQAKNYATENAQIHKEIAVIVVVATKLAQRLLFVHLALV